MTVISRVKIEGGNVSVTVNISYRWYAPGDDPWQKTSGAPTDFPSAGDWENRALNGSTSQARLYNSGEGSIAELDKFTRLKVGSKGSGTFMASGYTIPQYSDITWTVLSVKK